MMLLGGPGQHRGRSVIKLCRVWARLASPLSLFGGRESGQLDPYFLSAFFVWLPLHLVLARQALVGDGKADGAGNSKIACGVVTGGKRK